jgi:fido (protein-threonine AMPylation protein)
MVVRTTLPSFSDIQTVWVSQYAEMFHPFADGNGRAARIMMNAELVAAGENRIIVPTVYRNNYLTALKALSQTGVTGALVRVMDFAQRYTAAIDFSDLERARSILERTNAFADPTEADAAGIRLVLPTPEGVADAPQQ